jgi:hypothetical protein
MEDLLSYQFRSPFTVMFIFAGLALAGFGLGFMFWLDFRRRFAEKGRLAGWFVLCAGGLVGAFFGYQATQPQYFKELTARGDGVRLEYFLFADAVVARWSEIESVSIVRDRLVIDGKQGERYVSPVIHRGDQAKLIRSIESLRREATQ